MHYLKLALLAEGPSDHRFLPLVLRRLAIDLCSRRAPRYVEIEDEVLDLTPPWDIRANREELLHNTLEKAAKSFDILFIHADGAGNAASAHARAVRPLASWLTGREVFRDSRPVPVIPVREMEAWALADGEALRDAFGTVLDDRELGVPSKARDVETIFDPKRALDQAYERVVGGRHRRRARAVHFLSAIGERVRLERLRQVPAFQTLEEDFQRALDTLGYFR